MANFNEPIDLDSSDEDEIHHYLDSDDEFPMPDDDPIVTIHNVDDFCARREDGVATDALIVSRGPPQVQRRHAIGRGGNVYDPSGRLKLALATRIEELKRLAGVDGGPLFPTDTKIFVKLIFYVPRPRVHFVSGRPGNGI